MIRRKTALIDIIACVAISFIVLLSCFFSGETVSAKESGRHKTKSKKTKSICITFDQLPVETTFAEVDVKQITRDILKTLKKHKAPSAGFVIGQNIGTSYDLLGEWLNDGHVLGNLTYSHQDLNDIGIENFIKEISEGNDALETMLAGFGQKRRYFRYPYLHYGNTIEAKREVNRYLDAKGIVTAHVTVTVEDYLYNLSLEKLGDQPDSLDIDQIGSEYLQHVMQQVEKAEEMATVVLHRSCRQILALRVNRLNALVLNDLLDMLSERGYKFISLDKALADDLYSAPEAYFGARGTGYIEMIKESDPDYLPAR